MRELELASTKVLAVDDDELCLVSLVEMLEFNDYEVFQADNAEAALDILKDHEDIAVICLDRMMPGMDGVTLTQEIKKNPVFKHIPVVMQTAAASSEEMSEGIEAGVYYYLTKPYSEESLITIVNAAVSGSREYDELRRIAASGVQLIGLVTQASFRFRTLQEAKDISYMLSRALPHPEKAVLGITELTTNAIEHGNLGITYEEKKDLLLNGGWEEEVKRRLADERNAGKYASLEFGTVEDGYVITISDAGEGFDWQKFMTFDPERAKDPNGRGIFMSMHTSFDGMTYNEPGNVVTCFIKAD